MSNSNSHVVWNSSNGSIRFEGVDAILLWVDTALKSFLDTIEEVSGSEASQVVTETAGFRMGQMVTDFFNKDQQVEMLQMLPEIYESAGWGSVLFFELSEDTQTALIRMKDSWEFKINKQQGKSTTGLFLPGHFAGILTQLLHTNINYEIVKSQLRGDAYDEFYCYPTQKSPITNIHDYTRQQEQLEIKKLEEKVQERTKELTNLVNQLSSPIIPVLDNIVVIPLIGTYDALRAKETLSRTMSEIKEYNVDFLILDLTAIDDTINEHTISLIHDLTGAVGLLGTQSIIVGISANLAVNLTNGQVDLIHSLKTFSTLKQGIHHALAKQGKYIAD